MELLAAAIVFATVLYFVDKSQKWRALWKITISLGLVAVICIGAFVVYGNYNASQRAKAAQIEAAQPAGEDWFAANAKSEAPPVKLDFSKAVPIPQGATIGEPWKKYQQLTKSEKECVAKVRKQFPIDYKDMSDSELSYRVQRKFPKCDIPSTPAGFIPEL